MNWKTIERSGPDNALVHIKVIREDGTVDRPLYEPGDDLSSLPQEVQVLISTIHTSEVIARAKVARKAKHEEWLKQQERVQEADQKRFAEAVKVAMEEQKRGN